MTALKASFPALRRSVMCFFKVCLTGHGCREHSLVTYGAKAALYVKRLTWCSDDSLNVLVTTPPKKYFAANSSREAVAGWRCWGSVWSPLLVAVWKSISFRVDDQGPCVVSGPLKAACSHSQLMLTKRIKSNVAVSTPVRENTGNERVRLTWHF